jgi:pre-mRNA-splicing factor ATP-dependent RNA helicase DHX15/PRP43
MTDKSIGIYDKDGIKLNPLNNAPYSDQYKLLSKFWSSLPAYDFIDKCIESIKNNDVILVASGTGSGKTVLVPKFALHVNDYKGKIIITLPKKIITKAAAEFSAKTLDVPLGEYVGYQFKGENNKSKNTILLYSTDGSIISMIKNDPMLLDIDIVIIDEAHERKVQIDLLLYLLKNAIKLRKEKNHKPLKLIIMSATINEKIFEAYYKDFKFDYLFLSGKPNFPIESFYLDNSIFKENSYIEYGTKIIKEIVNNTNKNIKDNSGDILFFVTTINECNELAEKLEETIRTAFIMPLYSGFPKALEPYLNEQNKYKEINPNYNRRIFIATNVAESSLTIDGIVFVIDSGMEISVTYDPKHKINVMTRNIITKAQISQRKGRSGRTKNGYCFHLYTKEEEDKAIQFPDPEIKKIDIKNVCLSMLMLGEELKKDFTTEETIKMLTEFIEPPQQNFIEDGFGFLLENGCIDNNKISRIGKLISLSRLDITDGLCLVYAYSINRDVFYKVFKIICIYSLLKKSIDDLFFDDINISKKNEIIKNLSRNCDNSEHLLLYNIYKEIEENKNNNKVFNIKLFNDIKKTYDSQKHRIHQLYHRFRPLIKTKENVNRELSNKNIILSFNYGFKNYVAKKKKGGFVFNKTPCELKSTLKFDKFNAIIFYLNVFVSGKLNLNIISPYILD